MDLDQLLPRSADPSPIPHQAHGPEQIPLDHEAVEAPDTLLRVDPVQDQVVFDWRSEVVLQESGSALSVKLALPFRQPFSGSPRRLRVLDLA